MENIISEYLSRLKIPISEEFCKKRITSHPDYPSILAVSDTLQQLGIIHTIGRADKKHPDQISLPALLHLEAGGGSLLPVYESGDLDALADKLKSWSGVLLKVEPKETITDKENSNALKDERLFKVATIVLITATVGLVSILITQAFSWSLLVLAVTAIFGLLTGYFLFAKDLGITYSAVESFCNTGTGAGCGKVLRSEEGKLYGFITFSDVTLGYFATQLVAIGLLVPLWTGNGLFSVLGLISMFVLHMVGYSIWLQAVKIRVWCRLCLVVSGILIMQATIFVYLFYSRVLNPLEVAILEVIMTLLLFGLVGASLLLVKQIVQKKNQAVQNEIAAARLKNSPEIFTSLLFKQRQVDTTPFENDFLIGKLDAPIKLTLAVNLFCGPCKIELDQANNLFSIYPAQVSVSLRFLKSGDQGRSSGMLLKKWLHNLVENKNGQSQHEIGLKLIEKWYDVMDAEKFSDLYPVNGAISKFEADVYSQAHYDWIKQADIVKTPTTFINGYELPIAYQVKDLVSLIPGLADTFGNQTGLNKMVYNFDSMKNSDNQNNV